MQVHGKDADPFFEEDLEAAQALVDSTGQAELFLYPGQEHLFADSSLPAYDAAAGRRRSPSVWSRSSTRLRATRSADVRPGLGA